jgi:hypothetical protein
MATISSTPIPARSRRLVRASLFASALALTFSPFGQPAIARADFNGDFYDWCMNNLSEGSDYCCEHSGGVVRTGACIDPATLSVQGGGSTVQPTRQLPPGINMAPPLTAVDAGPTTTQFPQPGINMAPPATAANPG